MIICKNTDFKTLVIEYLAHMGVPKSSAVPLPKALCTKVPVAFSHAYHLYQAEMLGVKVVWALGSTNEFTPAQTEKAMNTISERLSLPVILVCPDIASYNISRLVERKVDFIIPGKQMFIPSMMIDLKSVKAKNADIMVKIHPLSQVVLLWQLEKGGLRGMTTSEIAEKLGSSYATANRAIRWLREKGLVTLLGDILVLAGDIGYLGSDAFIAHPFWDWAADNYEQVPSLESFPVLLHYNSHNSNQNIFSSRSKRRSVPRTPHPKTVRCLTKVHAKMSVYGFAMKNLCCEEP